MRNIVSALAFACAIAIGCDAKAQSLQVSPTMVELQPSANAATIVVRNPGSALAVAQIRIFRWTQKGGDDVLDPTSEVVASPPAARIPPGGEQIIRVVRASRSGSPVESSYRIVVDEIPNTPAQQGSAVVLRTQYSIPVFLLPERTSRSALSWQIQNEGELVRITATNSGERRSRITDLALVRTGGEKVHSMNGLFGYVLARSTRSWTVQPTATLANGEKLTISAQHEVGAISAVATVDAKK